MTKPTRQGATQTAQAPALSAELREKIATWNKYREWLEQGRKIEMELRKELAKTLVPNPREGNNVVDGLGFRVVLTHKINRRLDKTTLDAIMPQMPEDARVIGTLIRYEPAFNLAYYRALSPEAQKTFEQTLEITEGSPELEIVLNEPNEIVLPGTTTKEEAHAAAMQQRGYYLAGNPTKPKPPAKAKPKPPAKPAKPAPKTKQSKKKK